MNNFIEGLAPVSLESRSKPVSPKYTDAILDID